MTPLRLSMVQRQTAKLLSKSRAETVEVTVFAELDVTALISLRADMRATEPAPTITHFILAALARTLATHPTFNAHFTDDTLHLLPQADIGFAVSLETGDLISPVLRDVGALPLDGIALAARGLAERARTGALALADMKGAGFTFSSVGQTPVARFATPVIPVPQVAILAAMAVRAQPVVRGDAIGIAQILPVCLSFDHRALNGAAANAFLQTLADTLAAPEGLIAPALSDKRTKT